MSDVVPNFRPNFLKVRWVPETSQGPKPHHGGVAEQSHRARHSSHKTEPQAAQHKCTKPSTQLTDHRRRAHGRTATCLLARHNPWA